MIFQLSRELYIVYMYSIRASTYTGGLSLSGNRYMTLSETLSFTIIQMNNLERDFSLNFKFFQYNAISLTVTRKKLQKINQVIDYYV